MDPKGPFAKTDWFAMMTSGDPKVAAAAFKRIVETFTTNKPLPEFSDPVVLQSVWGKYAAIADAYNRPDKFTTFVGFEWTSAPRYQNLHRCVVFADKGPAKPDSAFDSENPEDLWTYLEKQRRQGLEVIAIPRKSLSAPGQQH